MQESPLLLTVENAVERSNLGRSTIYALLKSGELKSVKVGRARRIPTAALEEFVDNLKESTPRVSPAQGAAEHAGPATHASERVSDSALPGPSSRTEP